MRNQALLWQTCQLIRSRLAHEADESRTHWQELMELWWGPQIHACNQVVELLRIAGKALARKALAGKACHFAPLLNCYTNCVSQKGLQFCGFYQPVVVSLQNHQAWSSFDKHAPTFDWWLGKTRKTRILLRAPVAKLVLRKACQEGERISNGTKCATTHEFSSMEKCVSAARRHQRTCQVWKNFESTQW